MGTKDLTHEALTKALSENASLTVDQRSALISAIADDKRWQRTLDAETERLNNTIIHLRALLNEQKNLLVDVNDICGRDGFGGELEDGEPEIIDRIRAHLNAVQTEDDAQSMKPKNRVSLLIDSAVVGGAGMHLPPGAGTPPPGMGAVLLYVPLSAMAGKSPVEMQADMSLPWAGPNGEPFWFPQNQPTS